MFKEIENAYVVKNQEWEGKRAVLKAKITKAKARVEKLTKQLDKH